ncbi:uncharacterized protein BKA55DRAFT_695246 [Fusarium redolens]|uniref:Uncharacterized protein n=1 Tax=Fusarium redolens TaxID=48865 RepID=A0A9P9G7M4_FUSRE|nr:uncharacterized protein BKA55DRAFT_695246 [Fusarium redolens]KAH7233738.1 hypothetical protein BKA55DRAFT_695246 [Fusarium redolens]
MSPDNGRSVPSGRFPAPSRTPPGGPYLYQTTGNATDHAPSPGQEVQNLDVLGVRWSAAAAVRADGDFFPFDVRYYLNKWRKRQLYNEHPVNRTLYRSFELNFVELEKTDWMAAKLLMLFGYLDHRDLWLDLCVNATDRTFPVWLREVVAAQEFNHHYASLCNLSFVEAKPCDGMGEQVYEIHPAIHEYSRRKAKANEAEYVKAAVSLIAATVPRSVEKNFLETVKRLKPHAEQCMIHMEQDRGRTGLDLAELERFGDLFRHLGRYKEASRLYKGVLNILYTEKDPDELTVGMMSGIENNLGLIYHARREYDLALRVYDLSCSKRLQLIPEDHDALMMTQYNKGRAFLMLGKLDESMQALLEAATYFRQPMVWNTFRDVIDCNNTRYQIYFRILNDIGEIHLRENNVEQAEHSFREAFNGHEKYFHTMHPATFAVRVNIGRVCVERSQYTTANKIFEYIIATYTEWWGRHHAETMRVVGELAESHMRHAKMKRLMGDGADWELNQSMQLWTEVLSFYEESYGCNSDTAANSRLKLQQLQSLGSGASKDLYSVYYLPYA